MFKDQLQSINSYGSEIFLRIIYLFGDVHIGSSRCPNTTSYFPFFTPILKEHMYKSDKIIDLFIEDRKIGNLSSVIRIGHKESFSIYGSDQWSEGVISLYESRGQQLYNVRFHSADIRSFRYKKSIW